MKRTTRLDFLSGGGEMGALMRAKDWSCTPLGPVRTWPQSLRSAVSILLPSKAQIALFWGPELVTLYNDAYRPVFGGKHPQALGQPIRESWKELWVAGLKELFESVLQTGEAFWAKARPFYMERNGYVEETFFDVSYDPVRDESGRVGGVFCIVSDMTGRVLGERRLKLLRDLAAVPAQARSERDAIELSLGVLAAAPLDVPFADIALAQAPEWVPGVHDVARLPDGVRTGPGPWPERPRSAAVLALEGGGEPIGKIVLGISARLAFDDEYRGFFDLLANQVSASIASARAAEAERRRAEALAELDRAKTAFFSNVSHELRTPLTLMLGPVDDALADGEALPAAQRERLELARRSGQRLQKLVNTLLDFARIEAGRTQACYQPTDLGAFTAELASSFRSAVEKAGLELRVDCAGAGEPAYVDRDMWEKVVLNLLSNALKFTFQGAITVSLRHEGERWVLDVSDTGTGIPEAELPHVFERFRRVEGARGRTHEGTGIGLSLVQELVRLHGGTMEARSIEGRGSTFAVSIPAGYRHLPRERIGAISALAPTALGASAFVEEALRWLPDPAPAEVHAAGDGGSRPRIVLADDNADMREYVRRLLAPHYDVLAVADGEAALSAIRANPPDLVLADVMMPKLDGFGLLAALRGDPATAGVSLVLLSARAGEEARVEGLRASADDYIVKPFSARELRARIAARLELSAMRSAIQRERADLEAVFAQTPVPVAVLRGRELVFEMCNAAYRDVIGGRDVAGRALHEALPEVRGQGFDEQLREVMRTGVAYVGRETRVRLERRGRLEDVYFTYIYAPLRAGAGPIERVIAIANEVTEQVVARRRIEELADEARRSEQEMRDFVDNATVAMHWVGPDGTILWANRAELDMLGYRSEEYLGRNIVEFHAHREVIEDILARLHRDEKLQNYPAALRHKDGTLRYVLVNSSVKWEKGKFVHTRCFTRDITARKLAEDALRESEARYRAVVESQAEVVCRFRPDGTILFANGAYARSCGTTQEALTGRSLWDFTPSEDHAGARAMLARLTPAAPEVTIENRFETVDGTRWMLWRNRALAFDAEGRVTEAQSTGIDITERKRAEEALRDADRRKDEFLAILSHELRNPLAPISNALTLLHQADDDASVRHQARAVLDRQVRHLIRLVEDLLDVSRIGRGDVALDKRIVRVADIVASAVETSRPRLESGGHVLRIHGTDPAPCVLGDPVRLAQVIANLLNNAAAYTPHGGRIDVDLSARAGHAVISVRDTGVGMSADELAALFAMFRRGDAAKQHPSGFGIGLALSRRLVDMHGGVIEAASAGPGLGSEFTVRLPLAPQAADAGHQAPKREAPSAPKRILVVDDNRDAADSLGLVLRTLGAEVRVAHDGAAALAEFDACAPAVVLLDIGMPGMSGYDVARAIRSRDPQRRAALVALTGWGQEDDRRRAREAGFDHHLVKPAEIEVLHALLQSLQ